MKPYTLPVAMAALVAMAGCSVPVDRSARVQPDDGVPFRLLDADAPTLLAPPAETSTDAHLCFVRGRMLVTVVKPIAPSATAVDIVRALASPPSEPPGLMTAIADEESVATVNVSGGVAQVDLSQSVASSGSEAQLLLVAQLVCTLTALPGVGQVAFRLEGAPVEVPIPDGSLATGPMTRDHYESMLG